ncbi:sulfotransferase family protein [Sphingomonas koreensis]|nr:sulfotransferase family protein [Sphingomonas koreensis]
MSDICLPETDHPQSPLEASSPDRELSLAIAYMNADRLSEAESLVRRRLRVRPRDVAALCILADLAARAGIYDRAAELLREVLALAPGFEEAKINLARVLAQSNAIAGAIAILEDVLAVTPTNIDVHLKKLALLAQLGDYDIARQGYASLLERYSENARLWLGYGHLLKTIGEPQQSVDAFRHAIAIDPKLGDAWWGLANLKYTRFGSTEIDTLQMLLAERPPPRLASELHFTLGRVLEQAARYEESFEHYEAANRIRHIALGHDAAEISRQVDHCIGAITKDFFSRHADSGCILPGPIFVVGMPRAGSTLIEQILASHPMIEGTSELPIIPVQIHQLTCELWNKEAPGFLDIMDRVPASRLKELGDEYLRLASAHRKSNRPLFVDKLPNNWLNIGFIRLILPQAKIIDARRGAMACCFSNFKQHFARGQAFSYSLKDIGTYYSDYVRLMAHIDSLQLDLVHRVEHENLVVNPEKEIRAMLSYIGVPFDIACLEFHKNQRPVRTASSEQVRRPISSDSIDQWRHYEPWLDELKEALGPLASQ